MVRRLSSLLPRRSDGHRGARRGHAPTGRSFERVDEVYFFTFSGERIAALWGIEDSLDRYEQLGLDPAAT